ncbi:MAG: monovalent cation/H+ antiporter complex subunit F [Acidobacteriaceae bacterium]
MNPWLLAAVGMLVALVPCGYLALAGKDVRERLVGLETGGIVATLAMILLTMGFNRMPLMDLPLVLALLSFGAGIVFAHFFARRTE